MSSNQLDMQPAKAQKAERESTREKVAAALKRVPHSNIIGDALYMIGFLVEYTLVLFCRKVIVVRNAVLSYAGYLLLMMIRPLVLGLWTFWQDLKALFTEPDEEDKAASKHGKLPLFWNIITYALPVGALALLVFVVRSQLSNHYVLNVQLNGVSVGYVESEQVFESAREDVQERINNARAVMKQAGDEASDSSWNVQPTYTLAVYGDTMTESEMANAILSASGGEIENGTAVYIDGSLRFVTNEGDHLRTYLETLKQPYEDAFNDAMYVDFVHDIQLVDGVYLSESVMPYGSVVNELQSGDTMIYYTAGPEETVATVQANTGVHFDSLAALNPELQSLDQEVPEGTVLLTQVKDPELIQVKQVVRETYPVDIPYETVITDSDQYDYGKKVVVQEGVLGLEEVTQDTTYVNGSVVDTNIVAIEIKSQPVTEQIMRGTKLKSGMVAKVGSGSFVWPVPNYKYVSRWMSSYHTGADICAPYGVPVIASDSGVVVTAGWHNSYGNHVVIDHGNGYRTLYAHMSSLAVVQGQAVTQAQTIGYVGSTGNSTGNHCHFEMYQNGARFSAYSLFAGM